MKKKYLIIIYNLVFSSYKIYLKFLYSGIPIPF